MTTEAEPLDNVEEGTVHEAGQEPSHTTAGDAPIDVDALLAARHVLEQKVTTAEQKEIDAQARLMRMQADFDNFRRRTRQEREESMLYAALPVVTALLPVIDNFQRALAVPPSQQEYEAWLKGVTMIHTQLEQVLQQQGVEKMHSIGQPFDPSLHEAIGHVAASEACPPGTVAVEIQPGYRLHQRVVRPAIVHVAQEDAS